MSCPPGRGPRAPPRRDHRALRPVPGARGVRERQDFLEDHLGAVPTDSGELTALRIATAGPADPTWAEGIAWLRLGLVDRLLHRAVEYLRGRTVQGASTLSLPLVRALLADGAAARAQAQALLAAWPDADTVAAAHRALAEAERVGLHLVGASGFVADGPGRDVRAAELLADAYAPGGGRG
ncbi:hypothetical protein ACFQV2_21975 [Actinokineospora soli]|uniref:Uncharacterized protein n=1 Tax=Actinokineospora soli TaxID=1048753 RepID=A0ABW2TR76_9PSEU